MDTLTKWTFLRYSDFAGKLTPSRGVPDARFTPDQLAQWHLANRTLLVDTEAGVICRADGVTRAERARPDGYGMVYLGRPSGRLRWARAHRVVWLAAHGPIPGMYEINHRNGRRWDNRLANLDIVTHAANMRHAHLHDYEHVAGVPFDGPDDRPEFSPYATGDAAFGGALERRGQA